MMKLFNSAILSGAVYLALCGFASAGVDFNSNVDLDVNADGVTDFKLRVRGKELDTAHASDGCMLLLHGNSAPHNANMQPLFRKIKNDHECVVSFDFPGHGKTQNVGGYDLSTGSIETYVAAVDAVIAAYGLTNFTAAGWSLGGDVVMQWWNQTLSTDLAGFVLLDTPAVDLLGQIVDGSGAPIPSFQAASCASDVTTGVGTGGTPYNLVGNLTVAQFTKLVESYYSDCIIPENKFLAASLLTDPNARAGIIPSIIAGNVADEVTILGDMVTAGLPILYSYGADEELVNLAYMDAVAAFVGIPASDIVTFTGGHAALSENSSDVYAAIKAFRTANGI